MMPQILRMSPVDVAREHERLIGRNDWRYQVNDTDTTGEWAASFLHTNGFPTRIPLTKLGHLIILMASSGVAVCFDPIPETKKGR